MRGGPRRSRGVPGVDFGRKIQGSPAGFSLRHEIALEFVSGADFSCKLMCGAGPGDLRGSRGSTSAEKSKENRAEHLQPGCLQAPSSPARPPICLHIGVALMGGARLRGKILDFFVLFVIFSEKRP